MSATDVVDLVGGEVLADLGAVDGVVGGDVEVVGVGGDGPTLRDVAVGLVFGGGDDHGLAEVLSLFGGLLGPDAGLEVGSFLVEEVGGDIHEAGAGTTTEEEDFVLSGDVQQVTPQLAGFFHGALPTRGAVRDFEEADAGVVKVADGGDGGLDGLFGQDTGTCIEVISGFHCLFFVLNGLYLINCTLFCLRVYGNKDIK